MKVLHLIDTIFASGAELHLLTLCRYLKKQNVEVVVACLHEEVRVSRSLRRDFEKEQIRVINLNAPSRYNWRFLGRLANLIKTEQPNIVHSHLVRPDIAAALVMRQAGSIAFLSSVHGIYRDRWFGAWAAPLMRWTYRKADAIIAISSAVKTWLHEDLGICDDKITVIHYGIEPERFAGCNTSGWENGQPNRRAVIGSIGRLEPGKNFECLIHAMKSVRTQLPNASLLIAGHDPEGYGQKLETLIAELELTQHVRLIGFQKDVSSFLHGVDIFAFASRTEGFGQVVIEAMASGTPVVVSRIAPLTEIVKEGENGLLVDPDDPPGFARAIIWLLNHPEETQQISRRAQESVQGHFSARRMVDETIAVYDDLIRIKHCGENPSHRARDVENYV